MAAGRGVEEVEGIEPKAKGAGDALGATDATGVDTTGVAMLGAILSGSTTLVGSEEPREGSPRPWNPVKEFEGAEEGAMMAGVPNENIAWLFLSSEAGALDAPNVIAPVPVPAPAAEDDGAAALGIELLLSRNGFAEGAVSPNPFEEGATTLLEKPVNAAETGGSREGAPNGAAEGIETNLKLVEVVGTEALSGIVILENGLIAGLVEMGALKLKGAVVAIGDATLLSGTLTASRTFSQERHLSVPLGFCTKHDVHFTTSALAAIAQSDPVTGAAITAGTGVDNGMFNAADGVPN